MGTKILKALLPASCTLKIYTADVGALYQITKLHRVLSQKSVMCINIYHCEKLKSQYSVLFAWSFTYAIIAVNFCSCVDSYTESSIAAGVAIMAV